MLVFVVLVCVLVCLSTGETPGCGTSRLKTFSSEIRKASLGDYPSFCSVFTEEPSGQRIFVGGASLIQNNQVVTLATLVERLKSPSGDQQEQDYNFDLRQSDEECGDQLTFKKVKVICGTVDLQSEQGEGVQVRTVSRVLTHPDYSPTSLTNDLAVLLVEEPFVYTNTVSQVCLPRPGKKYAEKESCVAIGHGQDGWEDPSKGFGKPVYSKDLVQVGLPLWENQDCQDTLNAKHFQPNHSMTWKIHPSFLCAGGKKDYDTCVGDGGGPLLCEVEVEGKVDTQDPIFGGSVDQAIFGEEQEIKLDLRADDEAEVKLVQAGITAWGIQCGQEGFPGVYSDLRSAACWLDQIMSCYPTAKVQQLIDLRSDTSGEPSVNGLTRSECRDWEQNRRGQQIAACGCVQSFLEEEEPLSLDLRADANSF